MILENYIFVKTINKPKSFGASEKTFGVGAPEATPNLANFSENMHLCLYLD